MEAIATSTTITTEEVVLPGIVQPEELRLQPRRMDGPAAGELLVRVEATGVSFAEQQMRRGKYYDQPPFPFVPGYDLIGIVEAAGSDADAALVATRVAVVTKTGAWSTRVLVRSDEVVGVPAALEPADAEYFLVNGVTAWQMLHDVAHVRSGQTVLVHGANGGVGSALVQLARLAGARVLGTGSSRSARAIEDLGATPIDYSGDIEEQVRHVAPEGVDAVFDHIGGAGIAVSFRLLRRRGTLVSYGTAATLNESGNARLPVVKLFARLFWWQVLPNGRSAHFYNFWAGKRNHSRFYGRLRDALTSVLRLAASGEISARIAGRYPLSQISEALRFAESRGVNGKVILEPSTSDAN